MQALRLLATILSLGLLACGGSDDFDAYRKAEAKRNEPVDPPPSEAANEAARAWIKDTTPAARERLATLVNIAEAIDARPPVVEPALELPEGIALELDPKSQAFNAGLIQYDELRSACAENKKADEDPPVALLGLGLKTSAWLSCGACLAEEEHPEFEPGDPHELRACYERLLAPKFVVVVRIHERVDGEVVAKADARERGSFRAGAMWADVLLVRLEDGAYLGGFPVVGQNSEIISAAHDVGDRQVEQDLSVNFEAVLDRALAEHLSSDPASPRAR